MAPSRVLEPLSAESKISLPTGVLLGGVVGAMVVVAVASWVIDLVWSLGWDVSMAGVVGAAAVGVVAVGGVLVMTPWRARAIADWMTMWLGATVFRLFVTPVLVWVVYSAFLPGLAVKPLVISVASAYFVALLGEAAILAGHIRRVLPSV